MEPFMYSLVATLYRSNYTACRTCIWFAGMRPSSSDCHLSCAVGGDAFLSHWMVVGRLRWVMHLHRPPSSTSVHSSIRLVKEVLRVLRALLPLVGVAVSPGGAVHRGGERGGVSRGGHLTVDVARCWFPGIEGRAGEHWVCRGLRDAWVLQVTGGDGDGERGMEVMLRRCRLVDVRLLFMLPRHWLEGWRGHGLILGEVH